MNIKALAQDHDRALRILHLLPGQISKGDRDLLQDACESWAINKPMRFDYCKTLRTLDELEKCISPSRAMKKRARAFPEGIISTAKNKSCLFVFKKTNDGLQWRTIARQKPLQPCIPHNGYSLATHPLTLRGGEGKHYWVFTSSSLHARINRRAGLTAGPR